MWYLIFYRRQENSELRVKVGSTGCSRNRMIVRLAIRQYYIKRIKKRTIVIVAKIVPRTCGRREGRRGIRPIYIYIYIKNRGKNRMKSIERKWETKKKEKTSVKGKDNSEECLDSSGNRLSRGRSVLADASWAMQSAPKETVFSLSILSRACLLWVSVGALESPLERPPETRLLLLLFFSFCFGPALAAMASYTNQDIEKT